MKQNGNRVFDLREEKLPGRQFFEIPTSLFPVRSSQYNGRFPVTTFPGQPMQDINPITNKIANLRERVESLRGYL